jgi:ABC-type transport system involved in multi-copper enzyme maturation permease subunit
MSALTLLSPSLALFAQEPGDPASMARSTTLNPGQLFEFGWRATFNSGNYGWLSFSGGAVLFVLGWIAAMYITRSGIIARATLKESVRQPLFLLLLAVGGVFLVLLTFLPYFSLGEDVKMLKDCGLATLLIFGMILAMYTSSTSIADEIEGKTAMTLLSKPINRMQFIVGKFMGIVSAVALLLLPLMVLFVMLNYYKFAWYDARETSKEINQLLFQDAFLDSCRLLPGLLLIGMEITIMTAISVAISTRLPMAVNITVCLAVFVVGHLTPTLVQSQQFGREEVQFMARIFATILPSLEAFNISGSVATGAVVPAEYAGFAALYAALYCTIAVLLALILFEDRDLA